MLTSIELNNQLRLEANKVDNVWSDRLLTAKLEAIKSPVAQCVPELSFYVGLIAAKTTAKACFISGGNKTYCARLPLTHIETMSEPCPASLSRKGRGDICALHNKAVHPPFYFFSNIAFSV